MQSRTDQVHSYQFFLHRVISGLVARESDPAELPFRRLGWSAFGSIMVMALVAAGFGIYGLYVGGGATTWRDERVIVVEKASRTHYIYRDGRLHPMLNLVSAQLAQGGNAPVVQVTARSIERVPRGPTLGIPGAPESLPANRDLLRGEWTLCSQQQDDGRGGEVTVSVLGVGRPPDRGEPIDERAALVEDVESGDAYLVWRGHRFDLDAVEPQARQAIGLGPERTVPVAPAWLQSLPVGDSLAPPDVPDRGDPVDWLDEELEVRTGQVLAVNRRLYLVQASGLDLITRFQSDIVLSDSVTRAAYPGASPYEREDVPSAALTGVSIRTPAGGGVTSPPDVLPELVSLVGQDAQDAAVCAVFASGFIPAVWAGARLPWEVEGNPTGGYTHAGTRLVDYTVVPGGGAALVQTLASPEAHGGGWFIVTDQGRQYELATPSVAGMLGYNLGSGVHVPAPLLDRLPPGPVLNPAAALLPAVPAVPASPSP